MENLDNMNEDQRQTVLKKRQSMLEKMGVKNAGKVMNESVVSTNPASSSMAQKLADIRSGKAKAELNQYIKATAKIGAGNGGFDAIPETKRKKDPRANEAIKPEHRQSLEDFGGPSVANGQELNSIEALFGSDSPSRMHVGQAQQQQAPIAELDVDNLNGNMPVFNPHAALQNAKRKAQQPTPQQQSEYLKFASDTPPAHEEFVDANASPQQVNLAAMQMMMETIAKGIAEKTIRNVLNEYTQQQKNKVFFEHYNKEKRIIKTSDGKFYRIEEVVLKKKV